MRFRSLPRLPTALVLGGTIALGSAALGGDFSTYIKLTGPADTARGTNTKDSDKGNNTLARTIHIDAPMN